MYLLVIDIESVEEGARSRCETEKFTIGSDKETKAESNLMQKCDNVCPMNKTKYTTTKATEVDLRKAAQDWKAEVKYKLSNSFSCVFCSHRNCQPKRTI